MAMKTRGLVTLTVGLVVVLGPSPAAACGDKIVDISQGVLLQRAAAVRTGKVLLYVSHASAKTVGKLRSSLSRVGNGVEVVDDLATLERYLRSTSYDVVITALPDAEVVAGILGDQPSSARLIPFVDHSNEAKLDAARRAYGFALSVPGRANDQILTIDAALKATATGAITPASDS